MSSHGISQGHDSKHYQRILKKVSKRHIIHWGSPPIILHVRFLQRPCQVMRGKEISLPLMLKSISGSSRLYRFVSVTCSGIYDILFTEACQCAFDKKHARGLIFYSCKKRCCNTYLFFASIIYVNTALDILRETGYNTGGAGNCLTI